MEDEKPREGHTAESLSSNYNQGVIQKAIDKLKIVSNGEAAGQDVAKTKALLALLYFVKNDYVEAKKVSIDAYNMSRKADGKATLPAFIYGVSALYEPQVNFSEASEFFQWSVIHESENPFSPLMFAIFLDRMMYRMDDNSIPPSGLDQIYSITRKLNYDERKSSIQLGINNRYFSRLYIEHYRIDALTENENRKIKKNPHSLEEANGALARYKILLASTNVALDNQSSILENRLNSNVSWLDKALNKFNKKWGNKPKAWEKNWNTEITRQRSLLQKYSDDTLDLEKNITKLEKFQDCWFFCG